ncbi:hypothetical protein ACU60T_23535 [Klebsiella aerogenes]
MTHALCYLLIVGLTVVGLVTPLRFIKKHNGVAPGKGLAALLALTFMALAATDIPLLQRGCPVLFDQHLLLYVFALQFVLLDQSNHWLPLEFTAPFCVLAVVAHSLYGALPVASVMSLLLMGGLMAGCRVLLNRRYQREVVGLGDLWMMAGLAGLLSFTTAAWLLTVGLAAMLVAALLQRKPSLPLAPYVLFFAVLYIRIQPVIPSEWSSLL